jgi:hypothetical protein
MSKLSSATILGLLGLGLANAGQVQIGGTSGLNSSSGVTFSALMNPGVGQVNETATGGELKYAGTLFASSLNDVGTGGVPAPPALPQGNVVGGQQLTADGVTFSLVDQPTAPVGAQDWAASNVIPTGVNTVVSTITVPVGVFDVDTAWTMLNDLYATAGATSVTVQFNFGTTASVANDGSDLFTLTEGNQIRSSLQCTGSTGAGSAFPACSTAYTNAMTSPGSFNIWRGSYNGDTANALFVNTSGNLFLDAQTFSLTGFADDTSDYLVNMVITDTSTAAAPSRVSLSAVTVDSAGSVTASTPEPSTILLLLTGLGGLAAAGRLRRKKLSA